MRGQSALPAALAGLALAGALVWSRCRGEGGSDGATSPPRGEASSQAQAPPELVLTPPPTTSPAIAVHNLDAEIGDRERRADAGKPSPREELVGRTLMRARYVGLVSDLVAADEQSAAAVAEHPDQPAAHLARASALGGIHEFSGALEELDRAERAGAAAREVARARAGVLLATGRVDEAAALVPAPADDAPIDDLVLRGSIEAQLGHAGESERLFALARAHYRDVSPFTVAWMDFERSRALEVAGDGRAAKAYLQEAAAVMPSYTHAVAHLAALVPPDRALALVDGLSRSDDPEALAARADALRRADRDEEAAAVASRAKARFEEVLARLPLAFADHAAAFYLGMGADPGRALTLARANARNRPTDEAIELWLSSAQAAGSRDEACAASRALLARPHASPGLSRRATVAARGCP